MSSARALLVTGVGSGLGAASARAALAAGHRVVGTVRRSEDADRFQCTKPLHGSGVDGDVARLRRGLSPRTYIKSEYRYGNYADNVTSNQVLTGIGPRF